ncbi:hypothetical protein [Rhodobacter ferrooxidans]|uniref:Nucleic acid binding, OB-fold, tRNA/helicase-type n=1 Tax=Rhodobacter ferrooxidans TaxID=371731 RepID=C8S4M6_9RHOB|nr:hypothetical protein [Rhodobacter sp. SW2]EEW24025.1 nucleic acid binding, OB-fold, tRNA/helicase-type [Rhodobacter sp. SW2]
MLHVIRSFCAVGLALCLASAAQSETISPQNAVYHVGEQTTVEGAIDQVSVSDKGTIFLNFGGRFPNEVFYAVVFEDYADLFPDARDMEGRIVAISGMIEMYKGKPEIILMSPDQIQQR